MKIIIFKHDGTSETHDGIIKFETDSERDLLMIEMTFVSGDEIMSGDSSKNLVLSEIKDYTIEV